jgi:serine/threonine protein kinase
VDVPDGQKVEEGNDLLGVLPAGTILHGYELVSVLGQGGFGITYLARHASLGREVAIKEYLPRDLALRHGLASVLPRSTELAGDFNWVRERFLDEARNLVKLESVPGIVRVIDLFEANGTAYTVMALARGDTLEQRLERDGRLTAPVVLRLLWPLLEGLEHVHAAGFVHRDIKPGNIILDSGDRPTLIDFGAARLAMTGRTVAAMTAMYTPAYAAPEQVAAARQGPWTDIYGLSATLYHAITGNRPPSAMERTLDASYQSLASLAPPGFAPALLAGLDAGMMVRPADRPQSIADWRALLRAPEPAGDRTVFVSNSGQPPVPPSPGPPPPAVARHRRPSTWMSVSAAVLALVVAGYFGASALFGPPARDGSGAAKVPPEVQAAQQPERQKAEEEARRKAEAEARQKAALEAARVEAERQKAEEARQKADAEARQKAAAEAARAEAERQKVEEAARQKAEAEARQKAAAEAARAEAERQKAEEAARQKAEVEARQKAAAEAARAEAERQKAAGEAARAEAERQKAEETARQKAEADARDRMAAAQAGEAALGLTQADRQRLQLALTSLGFNTRGNDGIFGPRSREMIAAWQKAKAQTETGYLSAGQQALLLREGASAAASARAGQQAAEKENAASGGTRPTLPVDARCRSILQSAQLTGALADEDRSYLKERCH